jgi:mono/diheme cytochrome c family protein
MRLLLAAFLLTSAPALADPTVERGEKLAQVNCGPCHAIGKQGDSPNVKAPPFRDISKKYPVNDLEEALAEGIMVGHTPDMPQWRASPAQIEDLLAFLESVQVK